HESVQLAARPELLSDLREQRENLARLFRVDARPRFEQARGALAPLAQENLDRLADDAVNAFAPAPAFLRLVGEQRVVRAQAQPFGDEVCQGARAAFGPVEGGDHAEEVGALPPDGRAPEDVQARG